MTAQDILKKVWRRPRWVMQNISTENMPLSLLLLLMYFAGVAYGFGRAEFRNMGETYELSQLMLIVFVVSGLGGLITYHLGIALVNFVATRILKGNGSFESSRYASVLSMIPSFFLALTGVLSAILFGENAFKTDVLFLNNNFFLLAAYSLLLIAELVLGAWAIYIFLNAFAEAHKFSRWKAFFSLMLTLMIITLPFYAIVKVLSLI